jgi:two-component system CheB/CheR fusion protein
MKKQGKLAKNAGKGKPFAIVAIGASAGGLEAITEVLKKLPIDTGMAYIYIQHLDPTHKSLLADILARTTKMTVQSAGHLMPVKPNHVYVIPPDKNMTLVDGVLKLNSRKPKPAINMPIDKFFVSLAEKQNENSIGIILSGNAHDGTLGLKAIKKAGGLTIAQDDSAKFGSMPESAIADGSVDLILSPSEIAAELIRIGKNEAPYHLLEESTDDSIGDNDLAPVITLLKKSAGVSFEHYKTNTIRRRVIRRMLLNKVETLSDYTNFLTNHPNEISLLFHDILISVTAFFRDPDTFEYLKKTVLPKLVKRKASRETIRIWIPACSTGEEAYSMAMILNEILHDKALNLPIQVFATDLSEQAIAKARTGTYSKEDVSGISPKRLQRFFTKIDGSYRINKNIRDLCVFAAHNVFSDPPFSRLDLVSCCNLMIYLDTVLQKKIIATFHYALNNDGYLVLGKSETIGTSKPLFSQLEKQYKVYLRKNDAFEKAKIEMSYRVSEPDRKGASLSAALQNKKVIGEVGFENKVSDLLLGKYVPASIVINKELEILQLHGQVNFFLELTAGKPSLNLLKVARKEIVFDLKNTIHKSLKSRSPEKKKGIEIEDNGNSFSISIEVVPFTDNGEEKLFLVVIEKLKIAAAGQIKSRPQLKDQIVKQLQREIEETKEDMRSLLEEQEAGNEELQSANEEVVSSNEELQSINEELETSKEEIESTNEELMTTNSELQVRNSQLAESYEYVEALFYTVREPMLVLDKDLRVKSANKSFYRMFKVKEEETEGLPIYDLGEKQWNIPRLRELLEEIIPSNNSFKDFEVTHIFTDLGERVMLLNASKVVQKTHRTQLILLAIEDVTEQRHAQKVMADSEEWFRNMANAAPVIVWVASADQSRIFFNKTCMEFTGLPSEQLKMGGWKETIHPRDRDRYVSQFEKCFNEQGTFQFEYRLRRHDGEYRWMMMIAKPYYSSGEKFLGYIGVGTEIHNRKMMHEDLERTVNQRTHELRSINNELQRSNSELQQFAFVASHDLQEPLRKIMIFIDRIKNDKDSGLSETGNLFFEKILQSSKRMEQLIDDLLDFSSISFAERNFVEVDLSKTATEVLAGLDQAIREKDGKVTFGGLPIIQAVPLQMQQLFHNLLTNALKFAQVGIPPVINISCRMIKEEEVMARKDLDGNAPYAEIVFKDNGIGFSPEFSEQIFVIFQRLNDRKLYPGTGIGLALCRKIAGNHKGIIYAESDSGGAAFHVILPLRQNGDVE